MVDHLIAFCRYLRLAGIPVSTGEALDLMHALTLLEPSRENFLLAVKTTVTKGRINERELEKLFHFYLRTAAKGPAPIPTPQKPAIPKPAPRLTPQEFSARLAQMKDWLRQEMARAREGEETASGRGGGPGGQAAGRGTGVARDGGGQGNPGYQTAAFNQATFPTRFFMVLERGGEEELAVLAAEALSTLMETGSEDGETVEETLDRLKGLLDWNAVGEHLEQPSVREAKRLLWSEKLLKLESFLRTGIRERRWRQQPEQELENMARHSNLAGRAFADLNQEELAEVKRQVVRLARQLATRPGYRYKPSPHGMVDMARTVRLAAATGGVPLQLCHMRREPGRPAVVLLCDLSGSVAPYSRFMLLLVHTMQNKFRLARSFAFVDAVAEITGLVKNQDLERTLVQIQRQTGIWQTGFSDYGAVWKQFRREYLKVLNNKTTLIVLGDARNNYKPPEVDHFQEICRRARQVIWLNPAPREHWEGEDNIMGLYAPYCRRVLECRNLAQLTRIAREIF
ncbi:MAG: VWA domain-containing protein [Thermoanaerobacteraceae bacterium]|nr:VWA domain-containing protein [Thermoanaerobacteraceae bacterium]